MTFVHLQTAMIRCFGSLDFYFIDIDTEFLKKLETWLRTKAHYSDNSIGIRFRSLRTLYNQAVADNLVNITLLIFSLLYTNKYSNYNTLQKKQNRNKIGILGDSSVFTFHLISSLALGCTQSVSQSNFPHY